MGINGYESYMSVRKDFPVYCRIVVSLHRFKSRLRPLDPLEQKLLFLLENSKVCKILGSSVAITENIAPNDGRCSGWKASNVVVRNF